MIAEKFINAATTPPSPDIIQLFIAFHYFTIRKIKNVDFLVQGQRLIRSESQIFPRISRFNTLQFDKHRLLHLNTTTF